MTVQKEFEVAGGEKLSVAVESLGGERFRVRVGETTHEVTARRTPDGQLAFRLDGEPHRATVGRSSGADHGTMVRVGGRTWTVKPWRGRGASASVGSGVLEAPMTGTVLAVHVSVGDQVTVGQTVAVVTAMKMEHKLQAEIDGVVVEVGAAVGDQVDQGAVVVRIEAPEGGAE